MFATLCIGRNLKQNFRLEFKSNSGNNIIDNSFELIKTFAIYLNFGYGSDIQR